MTDDSKKPMNDTVDRRSSSLQQAIDYLREVIRFRLHMHLKEEKLPVPTIHKIEDNTPFCAFVNENHLSQIEFVTLLLALVPHVSPALISDVVNEYLPQGGDLIVLGGIKGKNHRGIIPTGQTVQFIIAGDDIELRNQLHLLFTQNHFFTANDIITLGNVPAGEPKMSGALQLDDEYVQLFTMGFISDPSISMDFPAQKIETNLTWSDLVLQKKTMDQIMDIQTWLKHNDTLLHDWDMKDHIRPGFRVMLYGPPGTGKTFTASLLGKYTERSVYRIDLSMVVSKYIGETEKNLSKLFDKAKNKNWILFFDEADAIFGKRTNVRDAHDKYANQEVSYLLQRIESHPGLVLLASNLKSNIDAAFTRRFQTIIKFENPSAKERLLLWQKNIPKQVKLDRSLQLERLAKTYELTGANIVNVIHYASLQALKRKDRVFDEALLTEGIKREFEKEGKMM